MNCLNELLKIPTEKMEAMALSELEAAVKDILPLTRPSLTRTIAVKTKDKQVAKKPSISEAQLNAAIARLST